METLKKDLQAKKDEADELQKKVQELEEKAATNSTSAALQSAAVSEAQKQSSSLRSELDSLREKETSVRAELEKQKSEFESLSAKCNGLQQSLDRKKEAYTLLFNKYTSLAAESRRATQELLTKQAGEAKASLESAKSEAARQTQQVRVLTQRLNEMKVMVETYRSRSGVSEESELKKLQLTVQEYDQEVKRLQEELETARAVASGSGGGSEEDG